MRFLLAVCLQRFFLIFHIIYFHIYVDSNKNHTNFIHDYFGFSFQKFKTFYQFHKHLKIKMFEILTNKG